METPVAVAWIGLIYLVVQSVFLLIREALSRRRDKRLNRKVDHVEHVVNGRMEALLRLQHELGRQEGLKEGLKLAREQFLPQPRPDGEK